MVDPALSKLPDSEGPKNSSPKHSTLLNDQAFLLPQQYCVHYLYLPKHLG